MNNIFSLSALLFLNTLYGQHEPTRTLRTPENPIRISVVLGDLHVNSPDVESILNNPVVEKKQKARNLIQATGFQEGKIKHFDIHFRRQQLHGEWNTYYSNEQACESGKFVNNLPDGEWKIWYPDGQLKAIVSYSARKFHYIKADIRRNHPKDKRYQITRYAGMNKNIKSYFQPHFPDKLKGTEKLSILHKIEHNTGNEGDNYIPPFNSCLHHGLYITYFENGLVRDSGHYVNGLKHEIWQETINDDLKSLGFYQHGQKHGQWKYYNASGKLLYTEHYNHGRLRSSHHFKRN
jgi:antitoxin component YwqK of YwqJK toxin-antitoxin module